MVAHLTSTCNSPLHMRRMPSANTSDLAQTLVRLAREFLGTPSAGDALESMAFGDGDAVNHLVLLEDGGNLDRLLEECMTKVDLVGDGAAIDLDLHQVGLLLLEWGLANLGVGKDANDSAVLLDTLEVAGDALAALLGMFLRVLGEGLLLAAVPVLVEASLEFVGKMLSPHSS